MVVCLFVYTRRPRRPKSDIHDNILHHDKSSYRPLGFAIVSTHKMYGNGSAGGSGNSTEWIYCGSGPGFTPVRTGCGARTSKLPSCPFHQVLTFW
jgi:hypothetical protein